MIVKVHLHCFCCHTCLFRLSEMSLCIITLSRLIQSWWSFFKALNTWRWPHICSNTVQMKDYFQTHVWTPWDSFQQFQQFGRQMSWKILPKKIILFIYLLQILKHFKALLACDKHKSWHGNVSKKKSSTSVAHFFPDISPNGAAPKGDYFPWSKLCSSLRAEAKQVPAVVTLLCFGNMLWPVQHPSLFWLSTVSYWDAPFCWLCFNVISHWP